jgi:hypothetical protein
VGLRVGFSLSETPFFFCSLAFVVWSTLNKLLSICLRSGQFGQQTLTLGSPLCSFLFQRRAYIGQALLISAGALLSLCTTDTQIGDAPSGSDQFSLKSPRLAQQTASPT